MKTLYIMGQLGRGGAEQQFYYLLKYLRPNACVISLTSGGYWTEPIRDLGIDVIELTRHGRADISRLLRIVRVIRSYQPDIVHIFMDNLYGLYGRLAALLTRHPCVIVGERAHPTFDPNWYIQLRRIWLNRHIRCVVANSQAVFDYLVQQMGLPASKALYIPNGIEVARIQREAHEKPDAWPQALDSSLIIGTCGSLSPRKNPDLFLRVAQSVLAENPDVRFLWVGDGELRSQAEATRDAMGLRDRVLFVGEQVDVPRWLGQMHIFVLTSRLEGTPNAIMEAMAVGLPAVVTDVGGNRSLLCDGEAGFVVPPGDEMLMNERICQLLNDADLRSKMGAVGRQAIQAYDVEAMAQAYERLYASMV